MIAAPWYLLAVGVFLVIVGLIAGALTSAGPSSANRIDPRMSDKEIGRRLGRRSSLGLPGILVTLGLLCVLVSAAWRLLRRFL